MLHSIAHLLCDISRYSRLPWDLKRFLGRVEMLFLYKLRRFSLLSCLNISSGNVSTPPSAILRSTKVRIPSNTPGGR